MKSTILCILVGARQAAREGKFYEVKGYHADAKRLAARFPYEDRDWANAQVNAIGEIYRASREY